MADFGTAVLWECFTADDIRLDDNVDKTLLWKPGTLREAVEITAKGKNEDISSASREILEKRFEELLNSVASLSHSHVVRYYGLLRPLTLITERTNLTLRNYLNSNRLIPARVFVSLCSATIHAIAFVHNAGFTFGGICPETIAVCCTGDTVGFKLDILETQFSPVPEQYRREGLSGRTLDLFSAGLTLSEVVLKHVRIGNHPIDPKASLFTQSDQDKLVDDACARLRIASEPLAELLLILGNADATIDAAAILAYFPSLTAAVLKAEYDDDLPPTAARLRYRYDKDSDAVKLTTSEDVVTCAAKSGCKVLLQGSAIAASVRDGSRKPLPFCSEHMVESNSAKKTDKSVTLPTLLYDRKTDTMLSVMEGKPPQPATCRGRKPVTETVDDTSRLSIASRPRKKPAKDVVCGKTLAGSNIPDVLKGEGPDVKLVAYCVDCFRAPRGVAGVRSLPPPVPIETLPPILPVASRTSSLDSVDGGSAGLTINDTASVAGSVARSVAKSVGTHLASSTAGGQHAYMYDTEANMVFEALFDGTWKPASCRFQGCGVSLAGVHVHALEYQRVCKPYCLLHYIKQEVELNEQRNGVVNKSDQKFAVCSVGGCGAVLRDGTAAMDQQRKFCRPFCIKHYTRFEWAPDGAPTIVNGKGEVVRCGYQGCNLLLKGEGAVDVVRHQLSSKPYCMDHYGVSPNLVFWDKVNGRVVDSLADVVTCHRHGCGRVLEGGNVTEEQQSRLAKPYCFEHYRETTETRPVPNKKRHRDTYTWKDLPGGSAVVSSSTGEVAVCAVCTPSRQLTVANHAVCPRYHRQPCIACRGAACDHCGGSGIRPCKPLCVAHYRDPVVRVHGDDLVEVGSDPPKIATCRGQARDTGGSARSCGKELKGERSSLCGMVSLVGSLRRTSIPDLPFCSEHLIWYDPERQSMITISSLMSDLDPQCMFPGCGHPLNRYWIDPILQQMAPRPFCTWHYKTKYRLDEATSTVYDAAERVVVCRKPGCGVRLCGAGVDLDRQRREARPYCTAHYGTRPDAKKQATAVSGGETPAVAAPSADADM